MGGLLSRFRFSCFQLGQCQHPINGGATWKKRDVWRLAFMYVRKCSCMCAHAHGKHQCTQTSHENSIKQVLAPHLVLPCPGSQAAHEGPLGRSPLPSSAAHMPVLSCCHKLAATARFQSCLCTLEPVTPAPHP